MNINQICLISIRRTLQILSIQKAQKVLGCQPNILYIHSVLGGTYGAPQVGFSLEQPFVTSHSTFSQIFNTFIIFLIYIFYDNMTILPCNKYTE